MLHALSVTTRHIHITAVAKREVDSSMCSGQTQTGDLSIPSVHIWSFEVFWQ